MTFAEHADAAAYEAPPVIPAPSPSPVRLCFVGDRRAYWRLMVRGALLQAITLGIYRFWLFTDMRRFLWASTEVEGDTLEYTGTAVELLLGFLMAIGILIPIYALFFLASLEFGLISRLSGVVAFVVLAWFGQYAAYRARRYRLTRTVFRGLRFHQTGSPVRYALRAMLWWIAIGLTLGLAYPWMVANLERYKMRNTFYGDLGGRFTGAGWRLFARGLLIWLVVLGPIAAGIVAVAQVLDWPVIGRALSNPSSPAAWLAVAGSEQNKVAFGLLAGAFSWAVIIGIILYPAYQAIVMRWWLGGLWLGKAAAASDLRMRRYYGAYLRYLFYVLLFTIAFAIVIGGAIGLGVVGLRGEIDFSVRSIVRDGAVAAAVLVAYVIYILGVSTIYQVVVKMRLWQVALESMQITNLAALDHVRATAATSSAVGEGLADALGTGGI